MLLDATDAVRPVMGGLRKLQRLLDSTSRAGRGIIGRLPPTYPSFVLVAFILNLYVVAHASPYVLLRPVTVVVVVSLAVTLSLGWLMGDRHRGAFVAALLALALVAGSSPPILIGLSVVAVPALVDRLRPGTLSIRWATVGRVMGGLIAVWLLAIGIRAVQEGRALESAFDLVAEWPYRVTTPGVRAASDLPDIYLILLDGYARFDKLSGYPGNDAETFRSGLLDRGFQIAANSRSNYPVTRFSLASMLNMRYLDDTSSALQRGPNGNLDTRYLINESEAFRVARSRGYRIVALAPGWEEVAVRQADVYLEEGLTEFEAKLVGLSALDPLVGALVPNAPADMQRTRIEWVLDEAALSAQHQGDGPRLVLAHVPAPHEPFVFGPNGERRRPFLFSGLRAEDLADYQRQYAGQAAYLGQRVLGTIDQILTRSSNPPVIVVFSDHGSASNWTPLAPEISDLESRTANLLAVLAPGLDDPVADDTTLVNALGPILNKYLGTDYPAQRDRFFSWQGTDEDHLFEIPKPTKP